MFLATKPAKPKRAFPNLNLVGFFVLKTNQTLSTTWNWKLNIRKCKVATKRIIKSEHIHGLQNRIMTKKFILAKALSTGTRGLRLNHIFLLFKSSILHQNGMTEWWVISSREVNINCNKQHHHFYWRNHKKAVDFPQADSMCFHQPTQWMDFEQNTYDDMCYTFRISVLSFLYHWMC